MRAELHAANVRSCTTSSHSSTRFAQTRCAAATRPTGSRPARAAGDGAGDRRVRPSSCRRCRPAEPPGRGRWRPCSRRAAGRRSVRAMPCRARMDTTSSSLRPVRARAPRRPLATRSSSTASTSATGSRRSRDRHVLGRQACDDGRHRRHASAEVAAMRAIFHISAASARHRRAKIRDFLPIASSKTRMPRARW